MSAGTENSEYEKKEEGVAGKNTMGGRYADIIGLSHHVSDHHPQMSLMQRAAQFSPFAALTGYDEAIEETARLTDRRILLDEDARAALDEKMSEIAAREKEHPGVSVTFFQADERKSGGSYVTVTGTVRKADTFAQLLIMEDGMQIPIADIFRVEDAVFPG
jgi:hypothetical protein